MSLITLENATLCATINPQGGWLETCASGSKDWIFPKQAFTLDDGSQKVRGGCHVCLPNFGPGGASGLPQHGFGRDQLWTIQEQSNTSVTLSLVMAEGPYAGLQAWLTYRLNTQALHMTLELKNDSLKPMLVAPGFHPYFVGVAGQVKINQHSHETTDLNEPVQITADSIALETGAVSYQLQATNLLAWVAWTDNLGDYVCVEPTQSGFSFNEGDAKTRAITLHPGERWDCELDINGKM